MVNASYQYDHDLQSTAPPLFVVDGPLTACAGGYIAGGLPTSSWPKSGTKPFALNSSRTSRIPATSSDSAVQKSLATSLLILVLVEFSQACFPKQHDCCMSRFCLEPLSPDFLDAQLSYPLAYFCSWSCLFVSGANVLVEQRYN